MGLSFHEKSSAQAGLLNQSQKSATPDAADGPGSHLPEAQNQPAASAVQRAMINLHAYPFCA